MNYLLRSLLFVPSNNKKMLDKIDTIESDGFVLDLEDSVPISEKEISRRNISDKLKYLDSLKKIFIRINDLNTDFYIDDIKSTINEKIFGYMIPKFESIRKLKEIIELIEIEEERNNLIKGGINLILMIENPRGIIELGKLEDLGNKINRIFALTIGWEDFTRNIAVFSGISEELLNYVRFQVMLYAKTFNILVIDTIYSDFSNKPGLENEVSKIVKMGFNGKLAIHPLQVDTINKGFLPSSKEINKMNLIIENRKRIEEEGAISINGVMYDPPHLKWALKVKKYLDDLDVK
jgi:citrate lyase subunit beta / citryl-CoA lyase